MSDCAQSEDVPLVTVLTVVYNSVAGVEETIKSVRPFVGRDVEYVVIDGGSDDGTLDVLTSHSDVIQTLISEPDHGIYDAMNKGIHLSRGVFVLHLNVGDRLLDVPVDFLRAAPAEAACVACAVELSDGHVFRPSNDWRLHLHNTIHHQGCFYRRSRFPGYDLRYKVFSDFDVNQKLKLTGGGIILHPDLVAYHDLGGVSHVTNRFYEVFLIVLKNSGPVWCFLSWIYFKLQGLKRRIKNHAS